MICAVALIKTVTAQSQNGAPTISGADVAALTLRVRSVAANEPAFNQAIALGRELLRQQRFNEAVDLFAVLAEKKPGDPVVLYGYALGLFNTGRTKDAETFAQRAVEASTNANNPARARQASDALVLLGVIFAVKGDDAAALKSVEQAVRFAPDNFDAQFALGRQRFGMGDSAGAVRAFRAALALDGSNGQARFFLGTALEQTGDTKGALATYRELTARQPGLAEGHLGIGVLLLNHDGPEAEEGINELRRALEINPNLYEARVTLGRALIARGRAADALNHLKRAAELAPNNPEPHYQLSLAYRHLGRREEAAAESAIVKRIHDSRRAGKSTSGGESPQ